MAVSYCNLTIIKLRIAAVKECIDDMTTILSQNIVNLQGANGTELLCMASLLGRHEVVKLLLEYKATAHRKTDSIF